MIDSTPTSAGSTELAELVARLRQLDDGEVFAGIPALARVAPDGCAVAVRSVDGALALAGDAELRLTLQSVSKPVAWAEALARFGVDAVLERVGVEPSGDRFDAVIRLEPGTGRPFNPMVNAGALAVASLFVEAEGAAAPARLLEVFSRWAGRPLEIDLEVALSERETAHRNRAIAYLLRHHGIIRAPVDQVLELYLRQCAILIGAGDLATIAGCLAGAGVNPATGERVLPAALVPRVLAVLATCGLYDDSGRFAFEVGLPAKTGISGAILAVAPGSAGLAALSPRLDANGHSVRGVAAIRALAAARGLNTFAPTPPGPGRRVQAQTPKGAATRERKLELEQALELGRAETGGQRAVSLAALLPESGLALATVDVDGTFDQAGESPPTISLQAAANPFAWLLVADAIGLERVAERVGVEPSGNPYHAIVLDPRTRRPPNPLGNAGAITIAGLVPGATAPERLRWLAAGFARLAGATEPLRVDPAVLAIERATGDRNRAISSLLRAVGVVDDEQAALELYLQQCSLRADLATVARLAATLARGGRSPTGEQLVDPGLVPRALALMLTCGLHDESGRAAWEIGLPLKSAISGLLVAGVPGVCGIAAWSPRVNDRGTPVAARAAVAALARSRGWNVFGGRGGDTKATAHPPREVPAT